MYKSIYSVVSLSIVQNPPKSASDTARIRWHLPHSHITQFVSYTRYQTKSTPTSLLQRLRSRLYPIGNINATHQAIQILRTAPPGEHVRASPKSYPTPKNTWLRLLPLCGGIKRWRYSSLGSSSPVSSSSLVHSALFLSSRSIMRNTGKCCLPCGISLCKSLSSHLSPYLAQVNAKSTFPSLI